jgi:RNA polymerase sigma-70 factor, ECF subfamily
MTPENHDPCSPDALDRFTRRLVALARLRLDALLCAKVDPEDVVQSVYKSFLIRYGADKLAAEGEHGLWALLTRITVRKCADRARHYRAERRDVGRETPAAGEGPAAWADAAGREPSPDEAVVLTETVERLFRDLDADERAILEMSLQGYSTAEIATALGRAERSVRRVRERARALLERMRDETAL